MQQRLLFEDKDLGRAFQEYREMFQELVEDKLPTQGALKEMLEGTMEEERAQYLQVPPRHRGPERRDQANGYYTRDLGTEHGLLRGLRVPRVRKGTFRPKVLTRYQRRRQVVDQALRQSFLAGVSTRRVGLCMRGLLGEGVSASTVSRVCAVLTREVEAFHRRPLTDHYRCLFLDGLRSKVREALGRRQRVLLCAVGITLGGRFEVIDFRLARAESEAAWTALLNDLYDRGLRGRFLRLVTTDGCPGLISALQMVYPFVRRQLCWFHKMQNVAGKVRKRDQLAVVSGARAIYLAKTRREAIGAFWRFAHRWRGSYPRAVRCVEEHLEELLAHFREPPELRPTLRTINPLESIFRQVRRRTKLIDVFNHGESLERVAYSVFHYHNAQRRKHPLWPFTQNS